jgi:prophage tail gpP-like protein
MSDKVELQVGGIKIEHFLSYHINSNLYVPADAFHMELANPETVITAGKQCTLKINGTLELTGIIDKVHRKTTKSGVSLEVEGRDFMGWLVDAYCEPPWIDTNKMTLKTLTQKLLANGPSFIKRINVDYQDNVVGKYKGKKKLGKSSTSTGFLSLQDTPQKIGRIEAGMTVFEVLKNYAQSRGMLFYCQANGTLVFGRPLAKGMPEYTLQLLKSDTGNNVIEADVEEDISKRYSKVIVVGQQQGDQTMLGPAAINSPPGIKEDKTFPFYKPFVTTDNNDNVSPQMRALMIIEKQQREGTRLLYTVGRHSQNSQNWTINKFCHIKDESQGINADYLIYGRTFEMNKQTGPITKVKLGKPGLIV